MVAVGVELGISNMHVAVLRSDGTQVIANDQGNRSTPAVVAFTEVEHLLGDAAKNQSNQKNLNQKEKENKNDMQTQNWNQN